MHRIEVDAEVYEELAKRAVGFGQTPNSVLRDVLFHQKRDRQARAPAEVTQKSAADIGLEAVLESATFKLLPSADARYLQLLAWAHEVRPGLLASVAKPTSGQRIYFAKSKESIERSGKGIAAKPVPATDYYALVTLDNPTKRKILTTILKAIGVSESLIAAAMTHFPTGVRR